MCYNVSLKYIFKHRILCPHHNIILYLDTTLNIQYQCKIINVYMQWRFCRFVIEVQCSSGMKKLKNCIKYNTSKKKN